MASVFIPAAEVPGGAEAAVPPLENGDHLTRDEFERRYAAMPGVNKAQLIEGVVYMPSPVTITDHGEPHAMLVGWVLAYCAHHPEVQPGDNVTVRLDNDNEPQPDVVLRRRSGGSSAVAGKYVEGPPELVIEVAATSAAIDLHGKKNAYRRNGVREYLVWRTVDAAVDWFVLEAGEYVALPAGADGFVESREFPALRLPVAGLLAGDLKALLAAVQPP